MKLKKITESFSDYNITPEMVVPTTDEVSNILAHKAYFDANIENYKKDSSSCKKTDLWLHMPWNISYRIAKKTADKEIAYSKLFKYTCIAAILPWQELLDNLTRTKTTLAVTKETINAVHKIWLDNIDQIVANINEALAKQDATLHENVQINETVEKHDTLNPKLWNADNTLKTEVADKINAIVADFVDDLKENDIKINVKDIKLVGSNCSYNYNDSSDLDIHIVADTDSLHCPDNLYPLLYSAYRSIWNKNHDISFYGIPVELFVETSDTKQMSEARQQTALKSNGIYSVLNNKWIKEPDKDEIPEVNNDEVQASTEIWLDKINELISSLNLPTQTTTDDKAELHESYNTAIAELKKLDSEKFKDLIDVLKTKKRFTESLQEEMPAIEADETIAKIDKLIEDIYQLRKDSIASEGEYGIGNLVFKELRNAGKLDELKQAKNELINQKFSLESLKEDALLTEASKYNMDRVLKAFTVARETLKPYFPDMTEYLDKFKCEFTSTGRHNIGGTYEHDFSIKVTKGVVNETDDMINNIIYHEFAHAIADFIADKYSVLNGNLEIYPQKFEFNWTYADKFFNLHNYYPKIFTDDKFVINCSNKYNLNFISPDTGEILGRFGETFSDGIGAIAFLNDTFNTKGIGTSFLTDNVLYIPKNDYKLTGGHNIVWWYIVDKFNSLFNLSITQYYNNPNNKFINPRAHIRYKCSKCGKIWDDPFEMRRILFTGKYNVTHHTNPADGCTGYLYIYDSHTNKKIESPWERGLYNTPQETSYIPKYDDSLEQESTESLEEDTVKQGNKWVNKGSEGTHGKFKTKKAADAQRKAMFANGYKG